MAIVVNIDIQPLLDAARELDPKRIQKLANDAVRDLSAMAYTYLQQEVQSSLHSTREKYLNALSLDQEDNGKVWVIHLDDSASWIEDGQKQHSMLPDLLKSSKAKVSASGSRYLVVPFIHNARPTSQTPQATELTNAIKQHFKDNKIPYGKLEKDDKGNHKIGLLHKFNVQTPNKTKNGPGQGHGEIGKPRVGSTGIPFLNGVRVYQKKTSNGKVEKMIMTFRVASSMHIGGDKWIYPNTEGKHLFPKVERWSIEQMEKIILPQLMKAITGEK